MLLISISSRLEMVVNTNILMCTIRTIFYGMKGIFGEQCNRAGAWGLACFSWTFDSKLVTNFDNWVFLIFLVQVLTRPWSSECSTFLHYLDGLFYPPQLFSNKFNIHFLPVIFPFGCKEDEAWHAVMHYNLLLNLGS